MSRRRRGDPVQGSLALFEPGPVADPIAVSGSVTDPVSDRSDTHEVADPARSLLDLIPGGGRIGAVFRLVGVAERVLEAIGDPGNVFEHLFSAVLHEYGSDRLFEAHVRELVARSRAGDDGRPATTAEVVASLMLTGLRAPLRSGAQALAVKLLEDIAPEIAARVRSGDDREEWPGQMNEQLADARRRLAMSDRVFAEPRVGSGDGTAKLPARGLPASTRRRARARGTKA